MWNKHKACLRIKESVGWTFSQLIIHLLNLKGPQLNRVVQVLAGHCNLQKHKKTTGRAEFSLRPKCSQEDETPNHNVTSKCKLYKQNHSNIAATVAMGPNEAYTMHKWTLPKGSRLTCTKCPIAH